MSPTALRTLCAVTLGFFAFQLDVSPAKDTPTFIRDDVLFDRLDRELTDLTNRLGGTATLWQVRRDLERPQPHLGYRQTSVEWLGPREARMNDAALYEWALDGVLIIAKRRYCLACRESHVSTASGFVISESGVAVTSYAVVNDRTPGNLAALTVDGEIHAVGEVLAADPREDLAVIQLRGGGFTPLPIRAWPRVGDPIAVVGHPAGQFFALTTGIISRAFSTGDDDHLQLHMTAAVDAGSAGAPILDQSGSVVGIVRATPPFYARDHAEDRDAVLFDRCTPAAALLRIIE